MTTPTDEERVGIVMREMLSSGQNNARPPVAPAELRNQATRRTLRRIDTKVVVAVAAVAAVIVTLIAVGPLRSNSGPSHAPAGSPSTTTTTTAPTTTTPTTTTTTPTIPAAAASQLDTYVAAEAATDSAAASRSGQTQPFVSDHSPPEVDGSGIVAVAAFSYDPSGHPVQVLGYSGGRWSEVAGLPAPTGQGGSNLPVSVVYLTQGPISVADVTGDGRPDFLVMASAADNVPGFVVSEDGGGTWRYIPFSGPYAPTPIDVIARSPQFQGNMLVSDYDNCVPNCAQGQNSTIHWTYDRSTGEFTAPYPPGYPNAPATTVPSS